MPTTNWSTASAPVISASNPAASTNANAGAMNAPSSGWARNPDTQSRWRVEWWIAWNRQNSGTVWLHRCVQYTSTSNSRMPAVVRTQPGSSPTAGRSASPGSHASDTAPSTTAATRPMNCSAGDATA